MDADGYRRMARRRPSSGECSKLTDPRSNPRQGLDKWACPCPRRERSILRNGPRVPAPARQRRSPTRAWNRFCAGIWRLILSVACSAAAPLLVTAPRSGGPSSRSANIALYVTVIDHEKRRPQIDPGGLQVFDNGSRRRSRRSTTTRRSTSSSADTSSSMTPARPRDTAPRSSDAPGTMTRSSARSTTKIQFHPRASPAIASTKLVAKAGFQVSHRLWDAVNERA